VTSRYGLTVDRIVTAERITDEAERRREYRRILEKVRSLAYKDGGDDERYSAG
jgi:hypothetical protein